MATYIPNTILKVLSNVPLDNTYSDVLKFESEAAQQNYFNSLVQFTFDNLSYQRVNSSVGAPRSPSTIRINRVADDLYNCNYIMFQNTFYGNKWFYAFIKQVNYISPSNCEIEYELDHYQTWQFNIQVLPSFVEREHTLNDSLYANLQPEPVSVDGHTTTTEPVTKYYNDRNIVVGTTTDETGKVVEGQITPQTKIYSGLKYHVLGSAASVNALLTNYATEGRLDAVTTIFMSPYDITQSQNYDPIELTPAQTLNGYAPRNKKLLSWPYCYIYALNGNNNNAIYRYEDFCQFYVNPTTGQVTINYINPSFKVIKAVCDSPALYLVPQGYKGQLKNTTDANLSITDFPVCGWSGWAFANWYANAHLSMYASAFSGTLKDLGTAVTNPTGALGSAAGRTADFAIDFINRHRQEGELGGQASGPYFNFAADEIGFTFYYMAIKPELAMRIDSFFDMFGYATNLVKVPNMTGRLSWNYVKTRDVIIEGSIPVDSMARIKQMFNDGVRFWHNTQVGNYSLSNSIIAGGETV